MDSSMPSVTITQTDAYKFTVDFGRTIPQLLVDEAEPIGEGEGPSPEQMLLTGVVNCLCASLFFALTKFQQDAKGITAVGRCVIDRNAEGRLRVKGIEVGIELGADASALPKIERVISQFENFCTVSESVKSGIPVTVGITDGSGARLK
jgi:uncharacterized OsmC-like protein